MANELVNIDGNASGNAKHGSAVIRTGRGLNLTHQVNDDRIVTQDYIDISSITDKWNDRFDDPDYYTA